ncbi:MAG TPA: hypothetical protein VFV34_15085 [Blastocatellia bacterium]|nr:hypothetical protein [Blastocatellia bacterium]
MKKPGITMVVIITLALLLGASAPIFRTINEVLNRTLPFVQTEAFAIGTIARDRAGSDSCPHRDLSVAVCSGGDFSGPAEEVRLDEGTQVREGTNCRN